MSLKVPLRLNFPSYNEIFKGYSLVKWTCAQVTIWCSLSFFLSFFFHLNESDSLSSKVQHSLSMISNLIYTLTRENIVTGLNPLPIDTCPANFFGNQNLCITMDLRGVAWSNGQHRRLPLQGSRDQISVFPFSVFVFLAKKKRKSTKVSRKEEMQGQRRSGKLQRVSILPSMQSMPLHPSKILLISAHTFTSTAKPKPFN